MYYYSYMEEYFLKEQSNLINLILFELLIDDLLLESIKSNNYLNKTKTKLSIKPFQLNVENKKLE